MVGLKQLILSLGWRLHSPHVAIDVVGAVCRQHDLHWRVLQASYCWCALYGCSCEPGALLSGRKMLAAARHQLMPRGAWQKLLASLLLGHENRCNAALEHIMPGSSIPSEHVMGRQHAHRHPPSVSACGDLSCG